MLQLGNQYMCEVGNIGLWTMYFETLKFPKIQMAPIITDDGLLHDIIIFFLIHETLFKNVSACCVCGTDLLIISMSGLLPQSH